MKTANPNNTLKGWLASLGLITVAFALFISVTIGVSQLTHSAAAGAITANVVIVVAGVVWLRSAAHKATTPILVRNLTGPNQPSFWGMVGMGLVLCWIVGQATAAWLYSYLGSANFESQMQSQNATPVALLLLVILVLAPAGEEVLMRGIAYSQLRKHVAPWAAALISAGVFSLLHLNLVQIAVTLPLGLLLAVVYEHTGRLLPVILLHMVFNVGAAFVDPSIVLVLATPWFILVGGSVIAVILVWLYTSAGSNESAGTKAVQVKS